MSTIIIVLQNIIQHKSHIKVQSPKKRYSRLCLIMFVQHCGTKKEWLLLELRVRILNFVVLMILLKIFSITILKPIEYVD